MVDKTKRGRPAETGERHPCGKLKRGASSAHSPILLKRMEALADLVADPRIVSQIFILRHFRLLTEPQYLAAQRVADIYRWMHSIWQERPNPKSASLEFTTAGASDLDPADFDPDYREWVKDTKELWSRLELCFDALRKEERDAVTRLCVHNQAVTQQELHDTIYRVLNRVSIEFELGPVPAEAPALPPLRKTKRAPKASRQERFDEGLYATLKVGRLSGPHAPAPMTDAEAAKVSARALAQDEAKLAAEQPA